MGTAIDFNQPIEVIIMALAARIDTIEDDRAQRRAEEDRRHQQNLTRFNLIFSALIAAIPIAPAIFAWISTLLKR